MADLGVPKYIPSQGAPVGGTEEDVAAGIGLLGSTISKAITKNKTDKLADSLEATAAGAVASTEVGIEQEELGYVFARTDQQELYDKLNRYMNIIRGANKNTRAAVINEAKRLTTNAMRNNPSLRDNLLQEYNIFVGTNPDLDYLGFADQQYTAQAQEASKIMDLIREKAYSPVANNGFGMNRTLSMDDPEFIIKFVEFSQRDAAAEIQRLQMDWVDTQTEWNLRGPMGNAIRREIFDQSNTFTNDLKGYFDQADAIRKKAVLVAQGKGTQEDRDAIEMWRISTLPEVLNAIDSHILNMMKYERGFGVTERGTEAGVKMLENLASNIEYMKLVRSMFVGSGTVPEAVELIKAGDAMRTATWFEQNPDLRHKVEVMERLAPISRAMYDLGLSADKYIFGEELGEALRQGIDITRLFMTQAAVLDPEHPLGKTDVGSAQAVSTETFEYTSKNPQEKARQDIDYITVNVNGATDSAYAATDSKEWATVYPYMYEAAGALDRLSKTEWGLGEVAREDVMEVLAKQELVDLVIAQRSEGTSPNNTRAVATLADKMMQWVSATDRNTGGIEGERARLIRELHHREFGESLSMFDLVNVDLTNVPNGSISIKAKRDAGEMIGNTARYRLRGKGSLRATQSEQQREQKRIEGRALALEKKINNLFRFMAHLDFFKNPEFKTPKYEVAFTDDYKIQDIFVVPGE